MKRSSLLFFTAFQSVFVTVTAFADGRCPVQDLAQDYASIYGQAEKKPSFLYKEIRLNELAPPALFIANELSCGTRGCEYALYQPIEKNCFKRIGSFIGHFSLLKTSHYGFYDFQVGTQTYAFDPMQRNYVEKSR